MTEQELTSEQVDLTQTLLNPTFEETEQTPLQEEINTLFNLADLIATRIVTAKSIKVDTSRLVNARGWILDLVRVLGGLDPYEFIPEKQQRRLIGVVIAGEIKILEEIVKFIEQAAPSFQEAIEKYNQPIIDQIKALRQLGDKTKDDQEELYKQMVVLVYPYFQMICQNLMEAKFQYENK